MASFLNKISLKVRRKWSLARPSADYRVIGVVEFPKSGITMFTHGLANAVEKTRAEPRNVTWFNYLSMVRDVEAAGRSTAADNQIRIEKSHAENVFQYNLIFLVRRDWRTHLLSWYEYCVVHFNYKGTFEKFLSSKYGVLKYQRFMRSYGELAAPWQKIIIIDYEDLIADPSRVFFRVLKHLGYSNTVSDKTSIDVAGMIERKKMIAAEDFYLNDASFKAERFVKPDLRNEQGMWDNIPEDTINSIKLAYSFGVKV